MGIRPFMEDLKWRAVNWHYDFYLRDKAKKAILSNQRAAPKIQWVADLKASGRSTKSLHAADPAGPGFEPHRTKFFTWPVCIPDIVPNRKSSNPFAPGNSTGWRESVVRRIADPLPRGKAFVSGTDDSVPTMPRLR